MLSFLSGPARGRLARSLGVPVGLALTAGALAGQSFVASTTSVVDIGGMPTLDDGAAVRIGGGAAPTQVFGEGQWLAVAGFAPSDVDALGRRPGAAAGSWSEWVFSSLSDEGGFADGDVIGFAPGGGLEVVVSEEDLALALGPASGIDVDALSFDDLGRLHFSLQNGLDASALGPVQDGDVLVFDPAGFVTLALEEEDVQAAFETASGTTASIGDVQGLVWTPDGYLVVTQGPSASDGAVLDLRGTPQFLVDEAGVGLDGAELDALALFDDGAQAGVIRLSAASAPAGSAMTATYSAGAPMGTLMVAISGGAGFTELGGIGGFGALYFDLADPFLNQVQLPLVVLDGDGATELSFSLPPGTGGVGFGDDSGWTFQAVDLERLMLSAPCRIALE